MSKKCHVVQKGMMWLALGPNGELLGSYIKREPAERAAFARQSLLDHAAKFNAAESLSGGPGGLRAAVLDAIVSEAVKTVSNTTTPKVNQPDEQVEPAVPEKHARFYHGGDGGSGKRWLTPDRAYAEGYANKSGAGVHYVDIPHGSPLLQKAFDDSGTNVAAPYAAFEAPEDVAEQLRPLAASTPSQDQRVNAPSGLAKRQNLAASSKSAASMPQAPNVRKIRPLAGRRYATGSVASKPAPATQGGTSERAGGITPSVLEAIVAESSNTTDTSAMTPSAQRQASAIADAGGTVIEDVPTNIKGLASRNTMAATSQAAIDTGLRASYPSAYGSLPTPEMQPGFSGKHFDIKAPYKIERDPSGPTMGQRKMQRLAEEHPEQYAAMPKRYKREGDLPSSGGSQESTSQPGSPRFANIRRGPGGVKMVRNPPLAWNSQQSPQFADVELADEAGPVQGPETYQEWRKKLSPAEEMQEGLGKGEGLFSTLKSAWAKTGQGKPLGERLKAGWKSLQENMAFGGQPLDRRGGNGGGGGGSGPTTGTPDGPSGSGGGDGGGLLGGLSRGQMGQMARNAWRFSTSPLGKVLGTAGAVVGGVANMAGAVGGALANPQSKPLESLGNVVQAGMGTTGAVVGGILGGPIGAGIGKLVGDAGGKLVGGAIALPEKLREFGEELLKNSDGLRRYSNAINETHARLQLQQLRLDAKTALQTGGSVQGAGQALMALRDELQPINAGFENIRNHVGTVAMYMGVYAVQYAKQLDQLLQFAAPIYRWARKMLDKLAMGGGPQDAAAADLFIKLRNASTWGDSAGRPVNWRVGERAGKRL